MIIKKIGELGKLPSLPFPAGREVICIDCGCEVIIQMKDVEDGTVQVSNSFAHPRAYLNCHTCGRTLILEQAINFPGQGNTGQTV